MQIDGITAIVTGAASGLGAATTGMLTACGAKVAGLDTAYTEVKAVDTILQHPCDVTEEKSVQTALAAATKAFGAARILVNCAGIVENRRVLGRDAHPRDERVRPQEVPASKVVAGWCASPWPR